jgi:hypothetical protein
MQELNLQTYLQQWSEHAKIIMLCAVYQTLWDTASQCTNQLPWARHTFSARAVNKLQTQWQFGS